MVIDNGKAKRLGIYVFYDAQGIADGYVYYFLDKILPHFSKLYVVCNGFVEEGSLARLRRYATGGLIARENQGLDIEAHRSTLWKIGFDQLREYDELVLMNATVYGPLTSFDEMFEAMAAKDLDFWGITSHAEAEGNPFPQNGLKNLPEHIQSYFIAMRNPMLRSAEFRAYWESLPAIKTYEDAVGFFECTFTRHFAQRGFQWATYTGTEHMAHLSPQPIIAMPMELVRDHHCPIVKRRSFFVDYQHLLYETNGDPGRKVLDHIRREGNYPVDLIWENLLRTCDHSVLRQCLQLSFILPDQYAVPDAGPLPRVTLWLHVHDLDMVEECLAYASVMPQGADALITTDSEEKKHKLEAAFSRLPFRRLTVICAAFHGRSIGDLLMSCAPYLEDSDVVCFAHDHKTGRFQPGSLEHLFTDRRVQNTLANMSFVRNVIHTFQAEPRLGMLCPPPAGVSIYYSVLSGANRNGLCECTKALYERLGLNVPVNSEHEPVAPVGLMFWFRPKALEKLFNFDWGSEDLPEKSENADGEFLRAVEQIIPYAAQQAGYYSAWVLSSGFMSAELTNDHYMVYQTNGRFIYFLMKQWLKTHLPPKVVRVLQKLKRRILRQRRLK